MMPTPITETTAVELASPAGVGVLEKAMSLLNIVSGVAAPMTFTELLR
ncbi:MAG: hypothetical protein H7274_02205, partial [Rhodoferax sp.]|nr:hypothetical protein [Rhodoferax sp.]